jgi:hypothetical protein
MALERRGQYERTRATAFLSLKGIAGREGRPWTGTRLLRDGETPAVTPPLPLPLRERVGERGSTPTSMTVFSPPLSKRLIEPT